MFLRNTGLGPIVSLSAQCNRGRGQAKKKTSRRLGIGFEALENRLLMAVSLNAEGWTVVDPSADTRTVYVSSSDGNDANDGLTAQTAKKTIAAATALIRDGSPDWLLLKRGDVFTNENFGTAWSKSGRSAEEPMLIGAYGSDSERPKVLTGSDSAFLLDVNGSTSNVAIIGLHFEPHTRVPSDSPGGFQLRGYGSDFIIEDNYISGYSTNVMVQATGTSMLSDVQIRRNVIINSWSTTSHSQGIFSSKTDNLLIEENFLDHNGWHETIVGAEATKFNHNMYLTGGGGPLTNVIVRGNVSSRASSMGLKFQPYKGTHIIENNLFVRNGYGLQVGGGVSQTSTDPENHDGFTVQANNNVIIEGDSNGATDGLGVTFANINGGSFSGNIIANKRTALNNQPAMQFIDGVGWESEAYGIRDFSIDNNIVHNWRGRVLRVAEPTEGDPLPVISNVSFANNTLQSIGADSAALRLIDVYTTNPAVIAYSSNTYYHETAQPDQLFLVSGANLSFEQWVAATGEAGATKQRFSFFDPTRTTLNYAAMFGITSYEGLMDQLRNQSRSNWNANYSADAINDFIREGFEFDPVGVETLPSPENDPAPEESSNPDLSEGSVVEQVFASAPFIGSFLASSDSLGASLTHLRLLSPTINYWPFGMEFMSINSIFPKVGLIDSPLSGDQVEIPATVCDEAPKNSEGAGEFVYDEETGHRSLSELSHNTLELSHWEILADHAFCELCTASF